MAARLDEAALLIGETSPFEAMALGGGDLSSLWRLRFESGQDVVVKLGGRAESEAAMLRAIQQTGASVPPLLAAKGDMLVLGYIPPLSAQTAQSPDAGWIALGETLKTLHARSRAPRYGWDEDYAFGSMPIPNGWAEDWRVFWRDSRLLPCLDFLPRELAPRVAHLAHRLERFLPATPRPVLLHGDLWTGNFIATRSDEGATQAVLIDPACTIGDASADFAILTLFSTPPVSFWQAYGPLPSDYETTINVYRLWPALVHYRLFGETYRGMVEMTLDALEI
ncbi:fructosamine kinase family protein [Asaia krungthepensis]|uniref:Fructosamine-3-kinase n=1 Tax=Asaia krungthepensis NRIC 0535 TaxID=1307925 RepID=A0ABQ0PZI9_9PROT|nr:fructosamine kinase family protein [Asaia krungthepensis]GBQ85437.1 fructosamine-3-kinase [Asaia krungthepensis NRIC 0535]